MDRYCASRQMGIDGPCVASGWWWPVISFVTQDRKNSIDDKLEPKHPEKVLILDPLFPVGTKSLLYGSVSFGCDRQLCLTAMYIWNSSVRARGRPFLKLHLVEVGAQSPHCSPEEWVMGADGQPHKKLLLPWRLGNWKACRDLFFLMECHGDS